MIPVMIATAPNKLMTVNWVEKSGGGVLSKTVNKGITSFQHALEFSNRQFRSILFDLCVVPQLFSNSSSSFLRRAVAASNARRRLSSTESPNDIPLPPST